MRWAELCWTLAKERDSPKRRDVASPDVAGIRSIATVHPLRKVPIIGPGDQQSQIIHLDQTVRAPKPGTRASLGVNAAADDDEG